MRRGLERLASDDTNRDSVLLTGSSGKIGRATARALTRAGWAVRAFDLAHGDDVRDEAAVRIAATGCRAVVHAGAIPHDSRGSAADIVATNLLGTWHVLLAAEQHGLDRVVSFSSASVFGFYDGEGEAAFLPVDDDHPTRAARPSGMSKWLAEDMCAAWTTRTGIPTVMLRPVTVVDDRKLARIDVDRLVLGAFVHVDDVADAVVRSLRVPSTDTSGSRCADRVGSTPHAPGRSSGGRPRGTRRVVRGSVVSSVAERRETGSTRAWRNRQTRQV